MFSHAWNSALEASFDRWANAYDAEVQPKLARRGYGYRQLAEIVLGHVQLDMISCRKAQVFELGVGTGLLGTHLRALLPEHVRLAGLDISAEMLKRAGLTRAYDQTYHSTAEHLPVTSNSCDAVVSAFMIHSILRRELVLSEIFRVLKPGGKLALVDLYRTTPRWPVLSVLVDNILSTRLERGAPSRYIRVRTHKRDSQGGEGVIQRVR
ncbi:class I SAM-dependent methyltransferase [Sphingosinicella sp.]|uniref:class I SAM-dependent methyltransferase n=1 Tax=Sphingosinicella sp. TaxID=1917971 RepID=UPI004037625A